MVLKTLGKLAEIIILLVYIVFWALSALVLAVSLVTTVEFRQYEQNDLFDFVAENIPLLLLSMFSFFALMLAAQVLSRNRSKVCRILLPGETAAETQSRRGNPAAAKAPFPWLMLIVAGAVSLFLVLAIRGLPTADASLLDTVIGQFMEGDYSGMMSGYLRNYPFQIFYVYFGEIIAHIFGGYNDLAWQLLNVAAIEFTMYFLYEITWELFESRRVCLIMQVLSCGAFCLYAFSTFIYLDLISMALQTAALYLQILFMKRECIRFEVGAGICITLAIMMKMNCLIALIAMILFLVVDALWKGVEEDRRRKSAGQSPRRTRGVWMRLLRAVVLSLMILAMYEVASMLLNAYTLWRTGMEIPDGFPMIAYLAMGLQMSEGKCGWYNGFTVSIWAQSGYDAEGTTELALEAIRESIAEFDNSGRYFVSFFYQKFISQWGDSTCVSMRELENTYRHTQSTALADSLIFGVGSTIMQWIMNVYHSMIYLGNLIYAGAVLRGRRRGENHAAADPGAAGAIDGAAAPGTSGVGDQAGVSGSACAGQGTESGVSRSTSAGAGRKARRFKAAEAMLVIFIFGGMFFHEFWEASGRYTMRYYLTMLPLAAWGWSLAVDLVSERLEKLRRRQDA